MAIPDHARANFDTLLQAAQARDLALMECTEVMLERLFNRHPLLRIANRKAA